MCVCCSRSSQRRFCDGVGGALRANQRTAAGSHARRPYRRRTERAASAGVARVLVSRSNCVQRSLRHSLQHRARVHVGAVGTVVACARQQAGGRQRPVAARLLPFVLFALEFVRLVARAPLNCQECRQFRYHSLRAICFQAYYSDILIFFLLTLLQKGSFHLLRTLFDDYLLYVLEQERAQLPSDRGLATPPPRTCFRCCFDSRNKKFLFFFLYNICLFLDLVGARVSPSAVAQAMAAKNV